MTNNCIYVFWGLIFLILCSIGDGTSTISGGSFLIIILAGAIFLLRRRYKKPEPLKEDCSMDEQV